MQHDFKQKKSRLTCPNCAHSEFKKKITTYPMRLFNGKVVNIGRVSVSECQKCHFLIPTKAGEEKISRSMSAIMNVMF